MVNGTSDRVPNNHVIRVVVYSSPVGRYYPQEYPADIQANGDWSSLLFIGVEEDVDCQFDIIVVLANQEAQSLFNGYLKEAHSQQHYPGLDQLPEGTIQYDRCTVTRR